jgi:hypothetical protein
VPQHLVRLRSGIGEAAGPLVVARRVDQRRLELLETVEPKNSSYPDAANAPGGQNGPREGAIWLLT